MHARVLALVLIAVAAATALPAAASPQSDFNGVYGDWKPDLKITPCRWSRAQLQNAYNVSNGNPDFRYETAFQDNIRAEVKRWDSGGCAGVLPLSVRRRSPIYGARIVSVKPRGGAAAELLRIRNGSKRTLSFRKASVRNLKGAKAVFPPGFRLAKGRTAVVHIGCAMGKRRASSRRQVVWLCRRRPLFRDGGDLSRLADARAVVVSQRGWGSQRRRPVF